MNRRRFIHRSAAVSLIASTMMSVGYAASNDTVPNNETKDWQHYRVTTQVDIPATHEAVQLWLPLPDTRLGDYQRAQTPHWKVSADGKAKLILVKPYNALVLHVSWPAKAAQHSITMTQSISTRDRHIDLQTPPANPVKLSAQEMALYLQPTRYLPTDGIVAKTANQIIQGRGENNIDRAKMIYDWVVANTQRDPKTLGCGDGNVKQMLDSGNLSGKCADINALFVALARSVGIPARDAYGVRLGKSSMGFNSLGKDGDITKAQHCRAEFYMEGYGWIPVDPADVRKVMLEEQAGGLPFSDPKVQKANKWMFGGWEMNWMAYNHAHDLKLPGDAEQAAYLMYPQAQIGEQKLDGLKPDTFKYSISSVKR